MLVTRDSAVVEPSTALLTPPRAWPDSFRANETLKKFLNKTLKGTKARLVGLPAPEIAQEAASALSTPLTGNDDAEHAARIHASLGWAVLKGFAVYELEDSPSTFVAKERRWNLHPQNIWVDLTPRPAKHAQLLLVECDVGAAYERGSLAKQAVAAAAAAPPPRTAHAVEEAVPTPPPLAAVAEPLPPRAPASYLQPGTRTADENGRTMKEQKAWLMQQASAAECH